MLKEELPLLNAINNLTEKGYSIESASMWLTFEKKITKSVLANAISGTIADSLRDDKDIDRGLKLLQAAKKSFSEDFLKKRLIRLPDDIYSGKSGTTTQENPIRFLKNTAANKKGEWRA